MRLHCRHALGVCIVFFLFVLSASAQVPVSLTPEPEIQFFDSVGHPLAGGKLYSYSSGTNTLQATYTDFSGTAQNTNPVILNSAGRAQIWLARLSYKLVLQNAAGQQIWSVDGVKSDALSLLSGANVWLAVNTFQAPTNFNDLANINAGGTFAGTISGQPNWAATQIFPNGIQIGTPGLQFTSPAGSNTANIRSVAPGYSELRMMPNGTAGIFGGIYTLYATDVTTSGGNDEFLNFDSLTAGNCTLVLTACYGFQSRQTGTGVKRPLIFDLQGGAPTVVMGTDGTTNFYNKNVVFTGTEFGATPFEVLENGGFLTFHNTVSPPVGPALELIQDVVETKHLTVGGFTATPTTQIINNMWTQTGPPDSAFTAIAAQTCQEQPMTITGVSGGAARAVSVSPDSNLGNVSLTWSGRVSGANTIQIKVCNVTSGSLTPSAANWAVFVAN